MTEDQRPDPDRLLFYGRRRGRKLRPKAAQHLEEGLTAYAIDDSQLRAGAVISPQTLFDHDPKKMCSLRSVSVVVSILLPGPPKVRHAVFIGAEPFINGVAALCGHIHDHDLSNVRIGREDVRLLLPHFLMPGLPERLLPFPDPWPKFRHRSRRILQKPLLAEMKRLIRPGACCRR